MSAMPLEQEIEYPTSDGQPMAETPWHQQVMIDLILGLRRRYAQAPDVWVGGNFFLCYERGNPNAHVSPDVMLARGVEKKRRRDNYRLWEERPPSLVVEVTSRSTCEEDVGRKKDLYERLGVEEYVLFDVFGDYLRPRLQGSWLEGGRYRPIPLEANGSLRSRTTGLVLRPEGERLRLVDAVTGEALLWPEEVEAAHVLAEERAAREAAAWRAEAAARREAEAAREAAEARAAEQAAARQAAEERLRDMEEELKRLRKA
jgi:Uma2 family endonuclease